MPELTDIVLRSSGQKHLIIDKDSNLVEEIASQRKFYSTDKIIYHSFTFGGTLPDTVNVFPHTDHVMYFKEMNNAEFYNMSIKQFDTHENIRGFNEFKIGFCYKNNGATFQVNGVLWRDPNTLVCSTMNVPVLTLNKMTVVKFTWSHSNIWIGEIECITDLPPSI